MKTGEQLHPIVRRKYGMSDVPAYELILGRLRSRRHPFRVAILPLGKEISAFVADDLRLTERGMTPDSRLTNRAPGMRSAERLLAS